MHQRAADSLRSAAVKGLRTRSVLRSLRDSLRSPLTGASLRLGEPPMAGRWTCPPECQRVDASCHRRSRWQNATPTKQPPEASMHCSTSPDSSSWPWSAGLGGDGSPWFRRSRASAARSAAPRLQRGSWRGGDRCGISTSVAGTSNSECQCTACGAAHAAGRKFQRRWLGHMHDAHGDWNSTCFGSRETRR